MANGSGLAAIEHVVVLMLENRSSRRAWSTGCRPGGRR
jgi:hypothetical protein